METSDREVRSIKYQMKVARFQVYRDLSGFNLIQSDVDKALVRSLLQCEFMQEAQNVVFIGGPDTVKTHLTTASGV